MVDKLLEQIKQQSDVRAELSALRAAIKDEKIYWEAVKAVGTGEMLLPLLTSEDAKVRKNAAALIGDLEIEEAAEALFLAYQREATLFVRGTLLQALGKTNAYPYLQELQERYQKLRGKEMQENEKKHLREELKELERILRKEGADSCHTFVGWNKRLTVLLTTNSKYCEVTAAQLQAERKAKTSLGVKAIINNLREVINIRSFRELLFPISLKQQIKLSDGPEALGEAVADSRVLPLLQYCHKESGPFYFRLDVKAGLSMEERSRYIKRAAAVIEEKSGRVLLNAPDQYEAEIRLYLDKEQKIHVFVKMYTIPMERFAYRKETISASIHPSVAAMLMELAKPYFKKQAQILDPCCGVGTMLVERHKVLPAREIYGLDIFGDAIQKARINTEEAGIRANFIHRDYMDFKHKYLFDEIITNMPTRGKKSKEEQNWFYERFFAKSKELLVPGGIMILYSDEKGFVKKQLRLQEEYELLKEYCILEKEQFYLFIIRMREK